MNTSTLLSCGLKGITRQKFWWRKKPFSKDVCSVSINVLIWWISTLSMIGCGFTSAEKWISYFSHIIFKIFEDLLTFYLPKAHFCLYHMKVSQSWVRSGPLNINTLRVRRKKILKISDYVQHKKIRVSTGFESVIPVWCSTNWAMKPHTGSGVNLLSSYLPKQWDDEKLRNNSYLYCVCRWKWRLVWGYQSKSQM